MSSAYPPSRDIPVTPLDIGMGWSSPAQDRAMHDIGEAAAADLRATALALGATVAGAFQYPNYALGDTPLEEMYGDHVARLREIREKYDPTDVMGLAGGFKF